MPQLDEAARDFLAQRRIAVAGVSRSEGAVANAIYKKLRSSGYDVFAINPNAATIEGDPCYPDLTSVPGGVDGLVVATHPNVATQLVRECGALGIQRVWMHRAIGQGSVDEEAVRLGRELGLNVIPGGCPMMYCEPVDVFHKCARWFVRRSVASA